MPEVGDFSTFQVTIIPLPHTRTHTHMHTHTHTNTHTHTHTPGHTETVYKTTPGQAFVISIHPPPPPPGDRLLNTPWTNFYLVKFPLNKLMLYLLTPWDRHLYSPPPPTPPHSAGQHHVSTNTPLPRTPFIVSVWLNGSPLNTTPNPNKFHVSSCRPYRGNYCTQVNKNILSEKVGGI